MHSLSPPPKVVIKRWDPVIEDITDEGIDADTVGRMKQSPSMTDFFIRFIVSIFSLDLKELDRYLGPYPYESLSKWIFLTNHVSKELVSRYAEDAMLRSDRNMPGFVCLFNLFVCLLVCLFVSTFAL